MECAGTSLTDLMQNGCFHLVVDEQHYECQVLLTIGNAMVQPLARALCSKQLKCVLQLIGYYL